jgi:hypothetical protein
MHWGIDPVDPANEHRFEAPKEYLQGLLYCLLKGVHLLDYALVWEAVVQSISIGHHL